MRMFGFGVPRPSGRGVVADLALHLECPWRIDSPTGTVVASGQLYEYGGSGPWRDDWDYEQGDSVQAKRLEALLGQRVPLGPSYYYHSGLIVRSVEFDAAFGDLTITFGNGHTLRVFAEGNTREQWRLFKPSSDAEHLVYGGS